MAKKKKSSKEKKAAPEEVLVDLTPEEMSSLPRPRDGFEAHVEPLMALYARFEEELKIKGFDASSAGKHLASFQALEATERSAAKHLEMVRETRQLHASKAWSAMLDVYAKAQAAARTNKELAASLADFTNFMKTGPRKKPEGK